MNDTIPVRIESKGAEKTDKAPQLEAQPTTPATAADYRSALTMMTLGSAVSLPGLELTKSEPPANSPSESLKLLMEARPAEELALPGVLFEKKEEEKDRYSLFKDLGPGLFGLYGMYGAVRIAPVRGWPYAGAALAAGGSVQGYMDYQKFKDAQGLLQSTKYGAAMVADGSLVASGILFATKVGPRWLAPATLIAGAAGRGLLELIPDKKK